MASCCTQNAIFEGHKNSLFYHPQGYYHTEMTFQQLEYIVSVDTHRHFVNAATACGVTQSTLSSTIAKLEQEIDVVIFDRFKRPVEPTELGKRIISQAKVILHNSQQLREMVQLEKESDIGNLLLGIIPSVSPYLYPGMARYMREYCPNVHTTITENYAEALIEKLQRAEIDMAILANTEFRDTNLLDIELYTERFIAYVSPASSLWHREWLRPEDLQDGGIWAMRAFHDHYPQLSSVTHRESFHNTTLDYGDLRTLISLVDKNGGYTLLPELFRNVLSAEQQKNIRTIQGPKFYRSISLVIRQDYMRERMLNIIAEAVKRTVPGEMISQRLLKFKITL